MQFVPDPQEGSRITDATSRTKRDAPGPVKGDITGSSLGHILQMIFGKLLSKSSATKHGLLEELEDTILMVEGISSDIVSDIATNIIRYPLIKYTHEACATYGIPLGRDVDSGPLWDPRLEHGSINTLNSLSLVTSVCYSCRKSLFGSGWTMTRMSTTGTTFLSTFEMQRLPQGLNWWVLPVV